MAPGSKQLFPSHAGLPALPWAQRGAPCPGEPRVRGLAGELGGRGRRYEIGGAQKVEMMKSLTYAELKSYLCMPAALQALSSLGGARGGGGMGMLGLHEGGNPPSRCGAATQKEPGAFPLCPVRGPHSKTCSSPGPDQVAGLGVGPPPGQGIPTFLENSPLNSLKSSFLKVSDPVD